MKALKDHRGFTAVELLLILIVIGILGFTGWFVWHSQEATNKTLSETNKSSSATHSPVTVVVTTFAQCKTAASSKMLETYPEQCVTKDGKTFTNPSQSADQSVKAAADSPTPAAGSCAQVAGATVTIALDAGVPSPRCVQVTASQTLRLTNPSDQSVTATLGGKSVVIPAGQSGTIDTPFGDYLQAGDHVVRTGLYGDSGPEIYLPAS